MDGIIVSYFYVLRIYTIFLSTWKYCLWVNDAYVESKLSIIGSGFTAEGWNNSFGVKTNVEGAGMGYWIGVVDVWWVGILRISSKGKIT